MSDKYGDKKSSAVIFFEFFTRDMTKLNVDATLLNLEYYLKRNEIISDDDFYRASIIFDFFANDMRKFDVIVALHNYGLYLKRNSAMTDMNERRSAVNYLIRNMGIGDRTMMVEHLKTYLG